MCKVQELPKVKKYLMLTIATFQEKKKKNIIQLATFAPTTSTSTKGKLSTTQGERETYHQSQETNRKMSHNFWGTQGKHTILLDCYWWYSGINYCFLSMQHIVRQEQAEVTLNAFLRVGNGNIGILYLFLLGDFSHNSKLI